MKRLAILFPVFVAVFSSVAPASTVRAEDEASIRKVMGRLEAAYNNHDAGAFAALYPEDCENWEGTRKGRQAYEDYFSERFKRLKNIQVKLLEEIDIVFVTASVAIYRARHEVTGSVDEDGNRRPPYEIIEANVLVKKSGRWLISTSFSRRIEE